MNNENKDKKPVEMIEIWNWESAKPTGKAVDRTIAHLQGIPHEGIQLWIVRNNNNTPEFILQHRAPDKELYPDCLDISVAGHVPFSIKEKKVHKEAYEELGLEINDSLLIDLGFSRFEDISHTYNHREIQHVYIYRDDRPLNEYRFVDGEVTGVYAVSMEQMKTLLQKDFTFTIDGFNGEKLYQREVTRKDFHPAFFTHDMAEYMVVILAAGQDLITTGITDQKLAFK